MTHCDIKTIVRVIGRDEMERMLGVGASSLSNYISQGRLPDKHYPVVARALKRLGHHVDARTLEFLQAGRGEDAGDGQREVLMVVGGGIAAYKSLELARRLADRGVAVTGVMTSSACEFITPLSLSALTEKRVYTDIFSLTDEAEMGHIRLARNAELVLVAPATANLMARAAVGMADDLATAVLLATQAPVMMAPSMNPAMWSSPATQQNLRTLRSRGVTFMGPASGDTACGEAGTGRMSEPEEIADAVIDALPLPGKPLAGLHAIVTSGPTHEPIDGVRYIANRSSGKQGHAIARSLAWRGARVTLVSGPVDLAGPAGVDLIEVETAGQMLDACTGALPAQIAVCAAAVADWRVDGPGTGKIKKDAGKATPEIRLVENPDILQTLARHRSRPSLVVGFAAESENVAGNARSKRRSKGCDWMLANDIHAGDGESVFGSDTNSIAFITDESTEDWPRMPKTGIADMLARRIEEHFS